MSLSLLFVKLFIWQSNSHWHFKMGVKSDKILFLDFAQQSYKLLPSTNKGRDEKGCLPSTKKKVAVDVDHRRRPVENCSLHFSTGWCRHLLLCNWSLKVPSTSTTALFSVNIDHCTFLGRYQSSCSFLSGPRLTLVDAVDIQFTALFITPNKITVTLTYPFTGRAVVDDEWYNSPCFKFK